MHTTQEKKRREESDPELQKFTKLFSARDAVLEPGILKSFEQLVYYITDKFEGLSFFALTP